MIKTLKTCILKGKDKLNNYRSEQFSLEKINSLVYYFKLNFVTFKMETRNQTLKINEIKDYFL